MSKLLKSHNLKIVVTKPNFFKENVDLFDAISHEIYLSTHGTLIIKKHGRNVKAYAQGQWETAEEVVYEKI